MRKQRMMLKILHQVGNAVSSLLITAHNKHEHKSSVIKRGRLTWLNVKLMVLGLSNGALKSQ